MNAILKDHAKTETITLPDLYVVPQIIVKGREVYRLTTPPNNHAPEYERAQAATVYFADQA